MKCSRKESFSVPGHVFIRRALPSIAICAFATFMLSGCAMFGESISSEELAKLATIEGARGNPLHSVDSKLSIISSSVNVEPGMHEIELTASCYNNNCTYLPFRFRAKAGYLYRLMPNNTIIVLDRNDKYQRKVDELLPVNQGGVVEFLNREEKKDFVQGVVRAAQLDRAAVIEQRKRNLPLVRKIGTKICQVKGEYVYVGFVESMTEEKLQIRVVEALMNINRYYRLNNFTPSIIWDSPLEWDLCE